MSVLLAPFHAAEPLPHGDLPVAGAQVLTLQAPPTGTILTRQVALINQLADAVAAGEPPSVVISGDCLLALGSLAGLQRAGHDPALVWFDAHGDIHSLDSSTSVACRSGSPSARIMNRLLDRCN